LTATKLRIVAGAGISCALDVVDAERRTRDLVADPAFCLIFSTCKGNTSRECLLLAKIVCVVHVVEPSRFQTYASTIQKATKVIKAGFAIRKKRADLTASQSTCKIQNVNTKGQVIGIQRPGTPMHHGIGVQHGLAWLEVYNSA
jgi:hypothetical protein